MALRGILASTFVGHIVRALPHLCPRSHSRRKLRTAALTLVPFVVVVAAPFTPLVRGSAPQTELTSIAEIRRLAPEIADRGLPVRIQAVVTRCTYFELYCQRGDDAIFVAPQPNRNLYHLGDEVEFVGKTSAGHFLPMVVEESSRLIAHGKLPPPTMATYDQLASGQMDCRYVAVEGVVHSAVPANGGVVQCVLAMGRAHLRVDMESMPLVGVNLFGARLRLLGVVGGIKNRQRQIVQPILWVNSTPESVQILAAPPFDDFELPRTPITQLMSAVEAAQPAHLIKIVGEVISANSDTHVYVRDDNDSVEVNLQVRTRLQIGDRVAVVGFAEPGLVKPHLSDAMVRVTAHGSPPRSRSTTAAQLLSRGNEASLVQIAAVVRSRYDGSNVTVLDLVEDSISFRAAVPRPRGEGLAIPINSRVAVTGISKIDHTKWTPNLLVAATAFELETRGPADITLLAGPPFWTLRKLLIVVGGLSATLLFAAGWIWSLRRTVGRQTRLLLWQTREKATREERDRIARELHDSLEQQLASATILLDATACAWSRSPDTAKSQLDAARAILRYSLDEAERAVMDLRGPILPAGNVLIKLQHSVERLTRGDVKLTFEVKGQPPPRLDAVASNHLLRIAQESITNALKHAAPRTIAVRIEIDDHRLQLRVRDDGCGFQESDESVDKIGKFGLIGLRERAEKLQGNLVIDSRPQNGTAIHLTIPLKPNLADERT